jgi:hypothetical protein
MQNIEKLIDTLLEEDDEANLAKLVVDLYDGVYRASLVDVATGTALLCPAGERTLIAFGVDIAKAIAKLDKKIADGFAQYKEDMA